MWTRHQYTQKNCLGYISKLYRIWKSKWHENWKEQQATSSSKSICKRITGEEKTITGNYIGYAGEVASKLFIWKPDEVQINRGRKRTSYMGNLVHDKGLVNEEKVKTYMADKNIWREALGLGELGRRLGLPKSVSKKVSK